MLVLSTKDFTFHSPTKTYVAELSDFGRCYLGDEFELVSEEGTWRERVRISGSTWEGGDLIFITFKFYNPNLKEFSVRFYND